MNVVLLVVDSLRAKALDLDDGPPSTPFLKGLSREFTYFRRAYAAECWTLPSHCSMFTGLLPSQHGAHFQSMAYTGSHLTIAQRLADCGFHTELVTRNFVFDGTIPGITRGFRRNTRILSQLGHPTLYAMFLALAKPRFRRHVRATGFFHPFHRENRDFVTNFARAMLPADNLTLEYLANAMTERHKRRDPYFFFCNLYDVHAPYPPSPNSLLRPPWSRRGLIETFTMHLPLAKIGAHAYLREGFRMSAHGRRLLLGRYHAAIELMDAKLRNFLEAVKSANLLEDTMIVITSDHGEAFGEHDLYLHDASVYDTHLHVPLWIHHPRLSPQVVDEVVTTRDLFGLLLAVGTNGDGFRQTILDPEYRSANPIALAEHFFYPHIASAQPRYRHNLRAAILGETKFIKRSETMMRFDLRRDPDEQEAETFALKSLADVCEQQGISRPLTDQALSHFQ